MPNLTSVKIFPPIGIARIGTSPETFIGPELPFPAAPPVPADGKYKDQRCRIRRQAQRFRLWGYYDDSSSRELTIADGTIQWTVHLANAKAVFQGEAGGLIDPGPRTLNGANDSATFANGTYHYGGQTVEVPLGDAYTDSDGRLVVVGGFGFSSSPASASLPGTFWQNAGWHDDISDGPVNATIMVNGQTFQASGAWVICPPPRFAPGTFPPVTLYDTLRQAALDQNLPGAPQPAMPPSFVQDIWPILRRGTGMLRVYASDFSPGDHDTLANVIPPPGLDSDRTTIFGKLAPPGVAGNLGLIDTPANMPLLNLPDYTYPIDNPWDVPATLRKFQYDQMQSWAQPGGAGFVNDWSDPPPPPTQITPEGLTRAALENCIGAPMYPGIEATVTSYDGSLTYVEAFRFDQTNMKPGDVTKCMARPWQADFALCNYGSQSYSSAAWWPSARPVSVYPEGSSTPEEWTHGLGNFGIDMVQNWSKFGFIVDPGNGRPVETEVSIVCRDCFIVTERNEIGKEEAQALVNQNQAITDGLYLVIEGYKPSDLGITTASPLHADLQAWFPNALTLPGAQQMSVSIDGLLLEDPTSLGSAQRVTLSYNIHFSGVGDFINDVNPTTVSASVGNSGVGISTSTAVIDLTKTVAPYMDHGPISYLSNDTRVFKLQPGNGPQNTVFPQLGTPPLGNDPTGFIQGVIKTLRNAASDQAYNAFESLPADEGSASLEWLPNLNGQPVFNFALCRVRYRAISTPASKVRVFFRLFQTAATGTDYNSQTTYKMGGKTGTKIPLLGVQGGELVTVPFFAETRQVGGDLNGQTDIWNIHDIQPDMSGKEVYMYFGCWLDINQGQQMYPIQPNTPNGPFPEFAGQQLLSIADLIRGTHQCMVTEINFDQQSIPDGVSTASSDMLSQRNLSIDDSENPGAEASRRVQHSFSFRPTTGNPAPKQSPDELMITWGNTPPGSVASIYMPGVRATEVMDLARRNFNRVIIEKIDDHTIRCKTGGVTYIPIPTGGSLDLAGLITVDLPTGIRAGDVFRIVVRQVVDRPSGAPQRTVQILAAAGAEAAVAPKPSNARYILGAFRFSITVKKGAEILPLDKRKLISLSRVLKATPIENRWYPVLKRNFDQILDRYTALGGNPNSIVPTPGGGVICRLLSGLSSLALAALAVAIGALAGVQQLEATAVAAVLFVAAAAAWLSRCRPRFCDALTTISRGAALGAGVLAIIALLGVGPPQILIVLAMTAVVSAALVVVSALIRCP